MGCAATLPASMTWTRLAILTFVLSSGCDRRLEPWVPPNAELPAPEHPVRIPGLERPVPRNQAAVISPAAPLRGVVDLAPGVQPFNEGVIFVIARSGATGPPLAVKRLPLGPFPLLFNLGQSDVMVPGRKFEGPIQLSARMDRDGDPLTKDPSDPSVQLEDPVQPGTDNLKLLLAPPNL